MSKYIQKYYKPEYHVAYRELHSDKIKEYQQQYYKNKEKERKKAFYERCKSRFFEMYGDCCACCGESEKHFLSVEHIHGLQGERRKSGINVYREVIKEYRPDLYEVLCMNCNHARMRLGYCPHKKGQIN